MSIGDNRRLLELVTDSVMMDFEEVLGVGVADVSKLALANAGVGFEEVEGRLSDVSGSVAAVTGAEWD